MYSYRTSKFKFRISTYKLTPVPNFSSIKPKLEPKQEMVEF